MANPINHISTTRANIAHLLDALEVALADVDEYNALGGDSFITPFFDEVEGYDITKQNYLDAITSLAAFAALLGAGHSTNLYRVK